MTPKASSQNIDNAIKSYLSGDSIERAATRWHTSQKSLSNILKAKGLIRNESERAAIKSKKLSINSPNKIVFSITDEIAICALFNSGKTENAISKQFNISRQVIRKVLLRHNIAPRTMSAANKLRYIDMSQDEKNAVIKNAQDSVRGKFQAVEHLLNRAKGVERTKPNVSIAEKILSDFLLERGVETIPQKAINKYNVDLAAFPVAIEVLSGFWHASKIKHVERARDIFSAGWDMIFVWTSKTRSPITPAVADYIIAFLNERRRNPSAPREYRVIRGDGKFLAGGRADDNNFSIMPKGFEGGRGIGKN